MQGDGRRQRDPADLARASSAVARVRIAGARCSRPVSPESIRCCGMTGKTMPSDLIRGQAVIFRKDHAQSKTSSAIVIQSRTIADLARSEK
jgi:hypothetical protein